MGLMKEMMKEIGNKSREFYEFVLPPIDMHLTDENLKVVIDIPGFSKKDIKLTLCGDILSIKAKKVMDEKIPRQIQAAGTCTYIILTASLCL